MKKRVTWIIVADGSRARVLANDGPGKGLRPAITGEFHHDLIVVAPARTLSTLRQSLSTKASDLIRAEIAKDLTHVPLHEMPEHLKDVLAL
jgi:protein required for attachment to host cells